MRKIYTEVELESLGYDGVASLRFDDKLDPKLTKMVLLKSLGIDISVV
jgi:hypothetical protein